MAKKIRPAARRQGQGASDLSTLYLQRHGVALPAGEDADDLRRPLSAAGHQALMAAARGLKRAGLVLPTILHSPWLRTEQTAWLMSDLMSTGRQPRACEALAPSLPEGPGGVQAALAAAATPSAALIVSHLPSLVQLMACWCRPPHPPPAAFEPGQLTCMRFAGPPQPGQGQLAWSRTCPQQAQLAPRQLDAPAHEAS